jgi:hypothetical protein
MSDERDERVDSLVDAVRAAYHEPPSVPREEIWEAVEARIRPDGAAGRAEIFAPRRRWGSPGRRYLGWGLGLAATGLIAFGVGIGRMTSPAGAGAPTAQVEPAAESYAFATGEYLGRSDALLRMVRADARRGAIDPGTGSWARSLLSQTRLLIDARPDAPPAIVDLLEDLELVLVQIVGVAEGASPDSARASEELRLVLRGLEESDVLPRLEAATPDYGMAGS